MKKLIAILSVFLVSIISGVTFGGMFNISPLIPAGVSFVASFIPVNGGCMYGLIATSPAVAAAFQFNMNYIPQFLMWEAAAAPLTNLRIEDAELGVICDLPAAGILQVRNYMRFGLVASTFTKLRIANGHLRNRNVTVTAVIAAAVAVPFYACSDCPGRKAFRYNMAALLAGQPTPFQDFYALFLPVLAAGDNVLIEFANGHSQTFAPEELLELTALYQNNQLATGFEINNINGYMHKATVTQAAAGAVYIASVIL